jgi:Spy/CpxP family protein refolding chaperone
MKLPTAIVSACLLFCSGAHAQHSGNTGHGSGAAVPPAAGYAGQQTRAVTSLSDDELAGLLAGKGLGLAKPAELNGFPGPMHVLELADKLGLTPDQRTAVQAIFERMALTAKAAGSSYVEAERALDGVFRSAKPNAAAVASALAKADKARTEVRMAHLAAHLETTPLLTPEQRATYARLRGYSSN